MNIAYSCNRNWEKYLIVNLYALLRHNPHIDKIYLFLEDDKSMYDDYLRMFSDEFNCKFIIINFKKEYDKYIKDGTPNYDCKFTNFSFAKLVLADYVDESKVLYLDMDTIVRKNIEELFDIDVSDYYLAGVHDYGIYADGDYINTLGLPGRYVNSGVVLFNLDRIRDDNSISQMFNLLNSKEYKYPDQDVLNIVCGAKEIYLPSMYNRALNVTLEVQNKDLIKVYHYAGFKDPWIADRIYAEEWYDELNRFNKYLKDKKQDTFNIY